MNAMTQYRPPAMSPALREAMEAAVRGAHPEAGGNRYLPAVQAEASRCAASMAAMLQPADAEAWLAFLAPLVQLPNAPRGAEALARAATTMAFALVDIPAMVLTLDAQRTALASLRFWPAPAELLELLQPAVRPLRQQLRAMRRIAEAPPAPPPRPVKPMPTPEERAAVAATVARFRASVAGAAAPLQPPRAAHLSGDALAAARAQAWRPGR